MRQLLARIHGYRWNGFGVGPRSHVCRKHHLPLASYTLLLPGLAEVFQATGTNNALRLFRVATGDGLAGVDWTFSGVILGVDQPALLAPWRGLNASDQHQHGQSLH